MLGSATPPTLIPTKGAFWASNPTSYATRTITSLSDLGWAVLLPQPLNSPILLTDLNPVKIRTQL